MTARKPPCETAQYVYGYKRQLYGIRNVSFDPYFSQPAYLTDDLKVMTKRLEQKQHSDYATHECRVGRPEERHQNDGQPISESGDVAEHDGGRKQGDAGVQQSLCHVRHRPHHLGPVGLVPHGEVL